MKLGDLEPGKRGQTAAVGLSGIREVNITAARSGFVMDSLPLRGSGAPGLQGSGAPGGRL